MIDVVSRCAAGTAQAQCNAFWWSTGHLRGTLRPRVYLDGGTVGSVADEPALLPGVNAVALSQNFALREDTAALMRAAAA
ncbi:MAG: hypothetical protein HYY97_17140 [Rhodocyclales bacterium]|nr:hypothetical protein [Rhodocyclales bacterium]